MNISCKKTAHIWGDRRGQPMRSATVRDGIMIIKLDLLRRPTNYAWKFGWGILNISCEKLWCHRQKNNNIQTQLKTIPSEKRSFPGGKKTRKNNERQIILTNELNQRGKLIASLFLWLLEFIVKLSAIFSSAALVVILGVAIMVYVIKRHMKKYKKLKQMVKIVQTEGGKVLSKITWIRYCIIKYLA